MIAFSKGESTLQTTKYKLIKLVEVKRMADDRIDQFCSQILKIGRYHRGGLKFCIELNCYVLFINEKLLEKAKLLESGKAKGITATEIGDNSQFFDNYSERVAKNEINGNKPLFIAANILYKAMLKREMSLLYPVLIEAVPAATLANATVEEGSATPPFYTSDYIGERNDLQPK